MARILSELISRFDKVIDQPDGAYLICCPVHDDTNPSLRIWLPPSGKLCIKCRIGCDTHDVVRKLGLESLNEWTPGEGARFATMAKESGPPSETAVVALAQYVDRTSAALFATDDEWAVKARLYASERFGVTDSDAELFGIGYAAKHLDGPSFIGTTFKDYPRLVVPFRDFEGTYLGAQGRDLTGNCRARWMSLRAPEKGAWNRWGVFRTERDTDTWIITEGPGDALSVVTAGFNSVCVAGASMARSDGMIASLVANLAGCDVVVCGDHDSAGQRFSSTLAMRLADEGLAVRKLTVPDVGSDVSDWRAKDPEAFPGDLHRAVRGAVPLGESADPVRQLGGGRFKAPTEAECVAAVAAMDAAESHAGLSNVAYALALSEYTNGTLKFVKGVGYAVWDGKRWEVNDAAARRKAHAFGTALYARFDKRSQPLLSTSKIDATLKEARSIESLVCDVSAFDSNPDLLSFSNGTVNLRTGELSKHRQEDMITQCLSIKYNPDAVSPKWDTFLTELWPSIPSMSNWIQILVGYGITGRTSEKCFVVHYGPHGNNGKTVYLNVLEHVFNEISYTAPFATFEEKPKAGQASSDIAGLRGSRLVYSSETEKGRRIKESTMKALTGSDSITARFLYKDNFTFRPTFLLQVGTNHAPNIGSQNKAMWNRVRLIPWNESFEGAKEDKNLEEKLKKEAEGIAAWAVRGSVAWYRAVAEAKRHNRSSGLPPVPEIEAATEEYKAREDTLAEFLEDRMILSPDATIKPMELRRAYGEWCDDSGINKQDRMSGFQVTRSFEERGFQQRKNNGVRALAGLRLRNSQDDRSDAKKAAEVAA